MLQNVPAYNPKRWPRPTQQGKLNPFARGGDLDLSYSLRATKKNLMEGNLHHQMGQNFINFFSWVDIHGIYDIVENDNQNWKCLFFIKHTVSN
jgi:hypothetical protein